MFIKGYEFKKICDLGEVLERKNGQLFSYYPQDQYNNIENLKLNAYGEGPFCRFKIPDTFQSSGVYCFILEGTVVYIGECENFAQRINTGYGNISPRNCFENGQSTNCKLNSFVLSHLKLNHRLELYFHSTKDFKRVEYHLIRELNPKLNVKDKRNSNVECKKPVNVIKTQPVNRPIEVIDGNSCRHSKYYSLNIYLSHQSSRKIMLTYNDLERLLCFKLPKSAYIYKMWWDNGTESHSQSRAWLNAGFIASEVELGQYVVFERK